MLRSAPTRTTLAVTDFMSKSAAFVREAHRSPRAALSRVADVAACRVPRAVASRVAVDMATEPEVLVVVLQRPEEPAAVLRPSKLILTSSAMATRVENERYQPRL